MNYRRIYKQHYGPIPIDGDGRTYDVHHKDGNRKNNDPSNLVVLSIDEHYNVHLKQNDWAACHRIASRMKLTPQIISELARKASIESNKKRLEDGTHNFQDPFFRKHQIDEISNIWEIKYPDGQIEIIKNLAEFCREKELDKGAMWRVSKGKRNHHKGFGCKKLGKGIQ